MEAKKIGALIARLRRNKQLTQEALAQRLHVSAKAVSKWETGGGLPDISLLSPLADALEITLSSLIRGELTEGDAQGESMKNTRFFICPDCGTLSVCTGGAELSCCGKPLAPLVPQKPDALHTLKKEAVEDEWYFTAEHPMQKEHYLSFAALLTGESLQVFRQYPQWDFQLRLPGHSHGQLLWYCVEHGLFAMRL